MCSDVFKQQYTYFMKDGNDGNLGLSCMYERPSAYTHVCDEMYDKEICIHYYSERFHLIYHV